MQWNPGNIGPGERVAARWMRITLCKKRRRIRPIPVKDLSLFGHLGKQVKKEYGREERKI
jgi:hypothetical protein